MIGKKVIVRTYTAGVHYGTLISMDGKYCQLQDSIRIWRWSGAATLSQLAMEGVKNPSECRFSMPVEEIHLTEAIEYIPCTKEAITVIENVEPWKV